MARAARRELRRGSMIIFAEEPEVIIATWNNMVVTVWRQSATVKHVRMIDLCTERMAKANPKGLGFLAIIEPIGRNPEPGVREEALRQAREWAHVYKSSAQVIEGQGFGAAIARTFVAGLNMLAPSSSPRRVFDRVRAAVPWLVETLGPHAQKKLDASELIREIDQMRSATKR
jgi:hypothetical protein